EAGGIVRALTRRIVSGVRACAEVPAPERGARPAGKAPAMRAPPGRLWSALALSVHKAGGAASRSAYFQPAIRRGLEAPAQAIPEATQTEFAPRFGATDDVRIHTGPAAAESAEALGAHAYTVGQDV